MTHEALDSFWPHGRTINDIIPTVPLYKFISLAPGQQPDWRDRLRHLLEGQAYLSSPQDFNDPFDCMPTVALPTTIEEFHDKLPHMVAAMCRSNRGVDPIVMHHILRQGVDANGLDALKQLTRESFEYSSSQLGVFCLSETINHVLMWSHYASNHTGIALRFDHSDTPVHLKSNHEALLKRLVPIYRVRYQDERGQVLSFFDRTDTTYETSVVHSFRVKASSWAYEKEWRVIEANMARKSKSFDSTLIKGVILGARISAADEEWIRDHVRDLPLTVEKMELDPHTFEIKLPIPNPA
jgi:Protein of unknown function (DUF2971)